jgi:hypothetical protein
MNLNINIISSYQKNLDRLEKKNKMLVLEVPTNITIIFCVTRTPIVQKIKDVEIKLIRNMHHSRKHSGDKIYFVKFY